MFELDEISAQDAIYRKEKGKSFYLLHKYKDVELISCRKPHNILIKN